MISATFKGTDAEVLSRLRTAASLVLAGLRKQLTLEMANLRRYIVSQKLSGQVLHHRSGALIDSIQEVPTTESGMEVEGGVQGGGGVAFYGIYFEEGGKGPYPIKPVNKKALAFFPSEGPTPRNQSIVAQVTRGLGKGGSTRTAAIQKFGMLGGVTVKSVMHPAIPKLPFMKPSLEENRERIITNLRQAAITALRS